MPVKHFLRNPQKFDPTPSSRYTDVIAAHGPELWNDAMTREAT
jgi:hypothetical protein